MRHMLNELRSSDTPRNSPEDSKLTFDGSISSLPEPQDVEQDVTGEIEGGGEGEGKERREEEGGGEGEGKMEGGGEGERDGRSNHAAAETSAPAITNHIQEVSQEDDYPRRRVGVIQRPHVVVVGGDGLTSPPGDLPRPQSSRPRSATTPDTHPLAPRKRLGSAGQRVKSAAALQDAESSSPTPPRSGLEQHKRPVKELEIKPVQKKPTAAAQRLVQSKKEKDKEKNSSEVDGGAKREKDTGLQNGSATSEPLEDRSGTLEVRLHDCML